MRDNYQLDHGEYKLHSACDSISNTDGLLNKYAAATVHYWMW